MQGVLIEPIELFPNGDKCNEGTFSASLSEEIEGRAKLAPPTIANVLFDIPNCSKVGVEGNALKSNFFADLN